MNLIGLTDERRAGNTGEVDCGLGRGDVGIGMERELGYLDPSLHDSAGEIAGFPDRVGDRPQHPQGRTLQAALLQGEGVDAGFHGLGPDVRGDHHLVVGHQDFEIADRHFHGDQVDLRLKHLNRVLELQERVSVGKIVGDEGHDGIKEA